LVRRRIAGCWFIQTSSLTFILTLTVHGKAFFGSFFLNTPEFLPEIFNYPIIFVKFVGYKYLCLSK